MRRFLRPAVKVGAVGLGVCGVGAGYTAWKYAPVAYEEEEGRPLSSKAPPKAEDAPLLLNIAKAGTLTTVGTISRLVMKLNSVEISGAEKLIRAVEEREKGRGLVTVSNHTSTVDDPVIFTSILPYRILANPKVMRWGVCSREICFKRSAFSAFFGAGNILPIHRGGGLHQPLFRPLLELVERGEWVHLFPEGGTCQTGRLGGRISDQAAEIGRLKWGVGKLIADASVTPIVVPIYHIGMQRILPQDPVTNKLLQVLPSTGKRITFVVGDEIDFTDLLEEYKEKRQKARRELQIADSWQSTDVDRELYSAICRRIEGALIDLEEKAYATLDNYQPTALEISTERFRQRLLNDKERAKELAEGAKRKLKEKKQLLNDTKDAMVAEQQQALDRCK